MTRKEQLMSMAPAGWYDDGSGRQRWWDGKKWTEAFNSDDDTVPVAGAVPSSELELSRPSRSRAAEVMRKGAEALSAKAVEAARSAPGRILENMTVRADPSDDPEATWTAVGKSVTGLASGRYKLTPRYLFLEKGTLSSSGDQVATHEIVEVTPAQSLTQKARGVGNIRVVARDASGSSRRVEVEDIPNFREGVTAITSAAYAERERLQLREKMLREKTTTQNINYTGAVPSTSVVLNNGAPAAASPIASDPRSLNEELTKLAGFKEQGILSDEEFAAAKRKLLGL